MSSDDTWCTYAEGTFLYLDQRQYFEREFLVRLVQRIPSKLTPLHFSIITQFFRLHTAFT